jgi:uncharacterized coiled-coil protein SlyX
MMKPEEISKLNRTIKFQRKAIEDLNKRISELEEERSLFREHFATRFKWWFQLISENQSPKLTWLAENDAMWLRRFKIWSF